jgi:hypothetical protein
MCAISLTNFLISRSISFFFNWQIQELAFTPREQASIESHHQGRHSPHNTLKFGPSMLIYNTVRAICFAHTNITSAILINDLSET